MILESLRLEDSRRPCMPKWRSELLRARWQRRKIHRTRICCNAGCPNRFSKILSSAPYSERCPIELNRAYQRMVTIVFPLRLQSFIFLANLTHATRFTAEEDPRNRPSASTRCLDMATASASVTLRRRQPIR